MDASPHHPAASRPLRVVGVTLAAVLLLLVAYEFRVLVLATLVGVGGGVLVAPVITFLKRYLHVPRSVSGLVVVLVLFAGFAGVVYVVYALVAGQAQQLARNWPDIVSSVVAQLDAWDDRFPRFWEQLRDVDTGSALQQASGLLMHGIATGFSAVTGAVLVVMVGAFTAVNARTYFEGFLTLFPARRRARVAELGCGAAGVLRRWFFSHLIVTLLSGLEVGVIFWLLDLDYWLLIALLTVALDFIPFVGVIVTGGVAALVTLGTQPDQIWWVLAAFTAVHVIEGDVTLPLVMKGRIRLPEAHLLVFVLMMGVAFGFVGMFVAAPLFAVLHYLYSEAYVPAMDALRGTPDGGVAGTMPLARGLRRARRSPPPSVLPRE